MRQTEQTPADVHPIATSLMKSKLKFVDPMKKTYPIVEAGLKPNFCHVQSKFIVSDHGWNIRHFLTSSFQLPDIFQNQILCLSEHCLFEEQKTPFSEYSSDHDTIVVCSNDNPDFMDCRRGYGGIAIFWKRTMSNFVEKLDIACDRIVSIQLFLPNRDPLFIFSAYLPSSSHSDNDYMEYLFR